ncbi:hypothetical protein PENSPDRAFT_589748 [Peniophora sp. CONT]|nr:hypothetical protein PENSPDRAFT_589748 [Peniophora sp. CONT]
MAPKGISSGTLNLRFMQRAAQAQENSEASGSSAAATIAVQDDSRWELPQAAKEGWGPSNATSSKKAAQHEASYLPFIFGEDKSISASTSRGQTSGRRSWNKKGEEVKREDTPASVEIEPTVPSSTGLKKLSRISGSGSGHLATARKTEPKAAKSKPGGKTARQALSQSGGAGVDLRAARKPDSTMQPSSVPVSTAPTTFMRPSGVDMPAAPGSTTEVTNGTKPGKRSREGVEAGEKKRKKKNAALEDET